MDNSSRRYDIFNYFNYKFSNLDGEMIKLDLSKDLVYPKYTKKEALFKNNIEEIKKYEEQNQKSKTEQVNDKNNDSSDEDDLRASQFGKNYFIILKTLTL